MNVLSRVRNATRVVHHSLDTHPMLQRILRSGDLHAYRGFLEAFRACITLELHHSEVFVNEEDRGVLDYEAWRAALENDLEHMAAVESRSNIFNLGSSVPSIQGPSEFWGFLYVMEGSVLGGREVAQRLPESWPKEFLLRGVKDRLRWPYFLRRMNELEISGEILSDAVELGAIKAFASMIEMFDRYQGDQRESLANDHSPPS